MPLKFDCLLNFVKVAEA